MKTNKHEILVLLDLKGDIINPITTAVSLAKLIDGHIHVFYVRKPIDVIESDSQLSALRTINRSYIETSNDIKNIIASMSKDFSGSISYSHTFGNIKHSILDYLKANSPDVIILGKKKIKPFNLIRNNITDFIVKNYEGAIMIAAPENSLKPNKELSLGVLNSSDESISSDFTKNMLMQVQKPLKFLKMNRLSGKMYSISENNKNNELIFDNRYKSMKGLSSYLTKSNINLLYVSRSIESKSEIKRVIKNVEVSVLIST
jgi:nucleotide-binding universal stress UspA family protein